MPDATTTTQTQPQADEQWRAEAIERLRQLAEEIAERNRDSDLTEDQIEAIAEEISREIIDDLVERGEISFERDRPIG